MLRLGTFAADVRGIVLAGLSTATTAVVTATDTILAAIGKLQAQLFSLPIDPILYGAVGNGAADDTTALQNTINAAISSGRPILLRLATYKISGAGLTVSSAITLIGGAKNGSTLLLATNGMTGITCTGPEPLTFKSFRIQAAGGVTGTVGISVSGSAQNSQSVLHDMTFLSLNGCVNIQTGFGWSIRNCHFIQFVAYGLLSRNSLAPDAGDSSLADSYFASTSQAVANSSVGLIMQSSGGLKVTNTKFVTCYIGFQLRLDANAVTGDLLISNSSFENMDGASIQLTQGGSGGSFHSAVVTGCQFNLTAQAISVIRPFGTNWLTDLTFSASCVNLYTNGYAFNLDGVTGFHISGLDVMPVAGQTNVAVGLIAAACSNGLVAPCNWFGAGMAGYVANNSANSVTVQPKMFSGSGSVAVSGAYGTLWSGTSAGISFPRAFLGAAPKVIVTPNSANGAVSAVPGSITQSGFNVTAVACASPITVTYDWVAYGDW